MYNMKIDGGMDLSLSAPP